MLTCVTCLHPCHCKGVGIYVNTNQCIGYDCNCTKCVHPIIEEKNMLKKIKDKIKKAWNWYVSWLFKWK